MDADIHTLYNSDFFRVLDFRCRCTQCVTSKPEHSDAFSISFVRKGNFLFNVYKNSLDSYTGSVLVTKPFYERTVTHAHEVPDECTIIEFKDDFYSRFLDIHSRTKFFTDNDIHSTLVKTNTDLEFLHLLLLQAAAHKSPDRLNIDHLAFEIINRVINSATDYQHNARIQMQLKRNHLGTIEKAKDYINKNFTSDISLKEIADHCYVSPFHFSRIFKTFTFHSPYQYLLNTRLKNAEILMRHTKKSVTDIAFSSGFNSLENFISAFHRKYNSSPTKYKLHAEIEKIYRKNSKIS